MYILLAEANDRRKKGLHKVQSPRGIEPPSMAINLKPATVDGAMATAGEAADAGTHRHVVTSAHDHSPVSADEEARPLMIKHPPAAVGSHHVMGAKGGSGGLSSAAEVLFYSAISAVPLLALAVIVTGEAAAWPVVVSDVYARLGGYASGSFWPLLASISLMETALAGSLVWCVWGDLSRGGSIQGLI